ncbi:MAG: polysaccharide deacetylase family protein [Thermomicrobiales bacterium]
MNATTTWPVGIQAAATITVDFEGESVEHQDMALPLWGRYSHGRYGAQVGTGNLLALFACYGVHATFFISAWDVERYPRTMEAIAAAGHEIAGSGYLHEDFSTLTVAEQEAVLKRSEAVFQSAFGQKPVGFRAPGRRLRTETRRLLAARGYRYDSSYSDDDRPYIVADCDGNRLVELPTHEPWTDKPYYEKHRTPRVVAASFVDEFDATHEVGGLFTLSIRPRGDYGSGRGLRVRAIEPLLQAVREHPNTWVTTCREIAAWTLFGDYRDNDDGVSIKR